MINYPWKPCDVFDLVKTRYNWTPVKVETFASRTYYSASGLSSQNNVYYWRPNEEIFTLGAANSSLVNPLFFGQFEIQIGNEDPVTASSANSYLIFTNPILQNINLSVPFYNLQQGTFQRYGVGTFAGRAFPAPGIVDDFRLYSPGMFFAPYLVIQEFTDGSGSIFINANISFSGFRIDMI